MATLQGKERATFVQGMFDRIAGRYNLMNRLMTLGQDIGWRRFVIQRAALKAGDRLLDLATGTGDIAFEGLRQVPGIVAVGGDFSIGMMQVGQALPHGDRVLWNGADALNLPYPDDAFDAVTAGYLMRNVIDIPRAFAEQKRVLKPGGRLVILDTAPPSDNLLRPFIVFYLKQVIPTLGRAISGNADAYEYLPESTQKFKTPEQLKALMIEAGFANVTYKTFMFGTMAVHWGEKRREQGFGVPNPPAGNGAGADSTR
ncbi:MAG: bifunctional demethylmenaquinone methyltransferase/2-methoxy-6-polyprenyl-1,4-benzoquinol methylase UbiE [Chloroflexota bacterium]|nr:bifunctional demethylmenaquinone methyltransferase/2-methoxy-6-polyprenyl-1,4-benzoquinol methylase UbiE [Chloroflexota bacterium]